MLSEIAQWIVPLIVIFGTLSPAVIIAIMLYLHRSTHRRLDRLETQVGDLRDRMGRDDWVTLFGVGPTTRSIARLVAMHRRIGSLIEAETVRNRRYQVVILVLMTVTGGAFWALVEESFKREALWGGAICSCLVTVLTLFQYTIGPYSRLRELRSLFSGFGPPLAQVRNDPERFNWHLFKHLESPYGSLGIGLPSREEVDEAEEDV